MRTKLLLALACLAVLGLGCTTSAGAGTSQVAASSTATAEPVPSATSVPEPSETEEPIHYPPYNVWNLLASGGPSGADDVAEAVGLADTVLLGTMSGIVEGEAYGPNENELGWYGVATIDVQEVIAGADPGDTVTVPFILVIGGDRFPEKELADLQRSIPEGPALLFLRSWQTYFDHSGTDIPGWLDALDRPDIYRLIGQDGAILVVDDAMAPPTHEEYWNHEFRGLTPDSAADVVRAAQVGA